MDFGDLQIIGLSRIFIQIIGLSFFFLQIIEYLRVNIENL